MQVLPTREQLAVRWPRDTLVALTCCAQSACLGFAIPLCLCGLAVEIELCMQGLPTREQLAARWPGVMKSFQARPISTELCMQGLPTREQLAARWPGVRAAAGKLAMLGQGHGGIISYGLAALAHSLKVMPVSSKTCDTLLS